MVTMYGVIFRNYGLIENDAARVPFFSLPSCHLPTIEDKCIQNALFTMTFNGKQGVLCESG